MKKLFPGILALLMAFGMMVGCGEKPDSSSSPADSTPPASTPGDSTPDDSTPAQAHDKDLKDAKDSVLVPLADENPLMNKAYNLPNSFQFMGETAVYDIAWTVAGVDGNAVEGVSITEGEATDTVNIAVDEDVQYILTATITCPDGCCTLEYSLPARTASAAPVPVAIESAPVENVAYKFYVYQGNKGVDCFLTGGMKNTYYFETTPDYSASIDLYVKSVDGGFNLYHVVDGTEIYINVVKSGTHTNAKYQALSENATPNVWTWDDEWDTIVTTLADGKYYLGCDGTYDTVEPQYKTEDGYFMGYLCEMKDKSEIVITDAEKVATTLDELKVATKFTLDKQLTLATKGTKYAEAAVTWAVEGEGATLSVNILELVVPTAASTVTLTATVSCGDVSETKSFTIELGPKSVEVEDKTDVAAILAAASNLASGETLPGTYTLTGEIKSIDTAWDAGYGNITVSIQVNETTLKCYRLKGSDAADASALKVGDTITVTGSLTSYNGNLQFAQGCVLDAIADGDVGGDDTPDTPDTPDEPEVPAIQTLTIPEAIAKASEQGAGKYTTEMYYVIGKITEVQNSTYGNVMISDGTNEILVYGMYLQNDDGSKGARYDKMETKPLVGDTVKLLSVVGMFNTTKQLKDAFLIEITAATDAEKVAVEKAALALTDAATGASSIALVANGASRADVAISWEVTAGNEIATISNGKLEITNPTAETTVTVKATITCGESIDSKTFDIVVTPTVAGAEIVTTFEFGANGAAGHADGNDIGTAKSYTEGSFTLALTNASKVFGGAKDEKGNSCLKLGTSKVVGSFKFVVPENVTKVIIKVAGYKAATSTNIKINGTQHTVTSASNNGQYDEIEIDTTETKTIEFVTVTYRCMINSITFVSTAA